MNSEGRVSQLSKFYYATLTTSNSNPEFTYGLTYANTSTGALGYDGPLYDRFLHMTDDMLGPSPMHIKYSSYVYDGCCL